MWRFYDDTARLWPETNDMIRAKCPRCQLPVKAPDEYGGRAAQCPKCGTVSRVPAASKSKEKSALAAAAVAAPSKSKRKAAAKAKPSLGEELSGLAGKKPSKKAARRKAASGLAAAVAAQPKRRGGKLVARTPRQARGRGSSSKTGLYVALAGLVFILGLGGFLWNSFSTKQKRQESYDAVMALVDDAKQACDAGEFEKAEALYADAKKKANLHRRQFMDGSLKEQIDQLKELITVAGYRAEVDGLLAKAGTSRKQTPPQYQMAQSYYKQAQRKAEMYYSRTQDAKLKEYVELAKKELDSDEIRMGSQGRVFYDGKWMTPEAKARLEKIKMGLVFYNNKWMKATEVAKLKAQARLAAEVARKAQLAKRKKKPAKAPTRRPRRTRPKVLAMDGNADVWMFDDFENQTKPRWRVESWGAPATLSLAKKGKNTVLKVDYTTKGSDKCALRKYIPLQWPFETRDELVLDVNNMSKASVQLTLAFFTKGGKGFYETVGRNIRVGETKNVVYDLRSQRFKCAETGWANKSPLKDPGSVTSMCLMLYPRLAGTITFDNIRFTKKGKR